MRVLLLHLDGKIPNLALMRLAYHHRDQGHDVVLRRAGNIAAVEPRFGDPRWDRVYASAIFERTRPLAEHVRTLYPDAVIGGTGSWNLSATLESVGVASDGPLDYSDYPQWRQSIGFTMRGCRLDCEFCVVPRKEGKARAVATIEQIWRGPGHPLELVLLDNDFFGNPNAEAIATAIRDGGFRVNFCQGINARMLSDRAAATLASLDYRATNMKTRRIYTAWDSRGDERVLFRGLEALVRHGVKPRHIMVYILIGYWPGETHEDRDYRRRRLREFGALPYPMPFKRSPELVGFARWVIGAWDKADSMGGLGGCEIPARPARRSHDAPVVPRGHLMLWRESWRADPAGRAVINNHYTRQSPESKQFVPPGRCVVLTIHETDQREVALWITSWPLAEYVKHAWPGAWVCSAFRNQRRDLYLSSSLIIEALAATRWYWEPPAQGMITFVDPTKIIRKRDPGRCFIKAGFHVAGMHYRCPEHPEVSPPQVAREAARRAGSGRCAVCRALLVPGCTCTPGPTQTADGKPALHLPPRMMPAPMMPLGASGRLPFG